MSILNVNNHIQLTIGYAYNDLFYMLSVLFSFFSGVFCFFVLCFPCAFFLALFSSLYFFDFFVVPNKIY